MSNPYWIDDNHLLQGPGVIHDLIRPESYTQSFITPRLVIVHSNASPHKVATSQLQDYMERTDITLESHLIPGLDGTIRQVMPFNRRADCNAQANGFAISLECQDNGSAALPWTDFPPVMFEAIAGTLGALNVKYSIPLTSPTSWSGWGVGYHSQFSQWSIYVGKTCPGAARIAQMPALRGRALQLNSEEEDMKFFQKAGKSAIWLSDRKTRQHVPSMNHYTALGRHYDSTVHPLGADANLDAELGEQCLSFVGDV
jgi:hypothetical protein